MCQRGDLPERLHRLVSVVAFAIFIYVVALASPAAAATGLVAAYSFEEGVGTTVADLSGNGNTGTISGATWTSAGRFGKALVFNGSTAQVTINDSPSLRLSSAMTLEAWVYPTATLRDWRSIIDKDVDIYYLMASSNLNTPVVGGTWNAGNQNTYAPSPVAINTWTHLAATFDGAMVRLYVNGTQVAGKTQTTPLRSSANAVHLGANFYGEYFPGRIDEVRIYNRALTPAEIQSDMNTAVASAPTDTTLPTAPASLAATASGTQVDLTWTASSDNIGVTGYRVERCQGSGCTAFSQVATPTTTTYTDTGLLAGTSYTYRVRAADAAGNLSGYSSTASATTVAADTSAPTAPSTLTAAPSAAQIALAWTASTDDVGVAGYRVERCQGAGCTAFTQVAAPTGTTYTNTGLLAGTSYTYRVRAADAAGNLSLYSNTASATTAGAVSGLVAAYSFDEGGGTTLADGSGNGNTGSISGATWTTQGRFGGALFFNGSNAQVTINDSPSLRLSSRMTLEAWVYPTAALSDWRSIIDKDVDIYYLMASSNLNTPAVGGTWTGGKQVTYAPSPLSINTWTHLAASFDGATVRLYINGAQVASKAQTTPLRSSANAVHLGANFYGEHFTGRIDEVRIYNRALSQAEIQNDSTRPVGTPPVDTTPPTAPSALTVAAGSAQVNLSWTASTDNVGVAGYRVERCQGTGCSEFVQVASPTATTYTDGAATASTVYRYRVRATDAAGNLGQYSNVAETSVALSISPRNAALTFTRVQQFTAGAPNVTWSVDGAVGGTATSGTITTTGLYTPPSVVGSHIVTATTADQAQSASATVYVTNHPGNFTLSGDNFRTGQNPGETVLTPLNVTPALFGKLFSYPLDGKAYASPLYVSNVNIPGQGFHNVVYVATAHNTVYAFDADGLSSTPLWQVSFIDPSAGITTVPAADTGECCDIAPEIGITGTPVIDPATGTLYVVVKTKEVAGGATKYVQRLHALDISSGLETPGAPVVIQASVPGNGDGAVSGRVPFDSLRQNQRAALLLSNGVIYIAFGSHGDIHPWHGWVLGYSASTLQQVLAYNVTPTSYGGGIWQGGSGLAADAAGDIYFVTGNGGFDADTGGVNYGDSVMKISPTGAVLDYFTPHDEGSLESADLDLGSAGALLLPDQTGAHPHLLLTAGKGGNVYLISRDNMGHYNPRDDSQIVQSLVAVFPSGSILNGNFISPVYFNGSVYFSPISDTIKSFRLTNGLLSTSPTSQSAVTYSYPGATLAISANGNDKGILWAVQRNGSSASGVLRAYDATNLAVELYNSTQAGSRDALDIGGKFNTPVVVNGKVFVGSVGQLTVYGLLP